MPTVAPVFGSTAPQGKAQACSGGKGWGRLAHAANTDSARTAIEILIFFIARE